MIPAPTPNTPLVGLGTLVAAATTKTQAQATVMAPTEVAPEEPAPKPGRSMASNLLIAFGALIVSVSFINYRIRRKNKPL